MAEIWITEICDSLNQLRKIEAKIKRLHNTKEYIELYTKQLEEKAEKEKQQKPKENKENKNEPSKDDFKKACDTYLNQLKQERIKNDELQAQIKALKAKLAASEDNNRILLTTIDILNNKLEDIEEYLYMNDRDNDFEYNEEEEKCEDKKKHDKKEDKKA